MFIVGISLFDVLKDPLFLQNEYFKTNLNKGYDLVCDVGLGMQLCMMNHTKDNFVYISHKGTKLSVEYTDQHQCLNVILKNNTQINDIFNSNDTDCPYAFAFTTQDGWKINELDTHGNEKYGTYYAGKIIHQWWEKFWLLD